MQSRSEIVLKQYCFLSQKLIKQNREAGKLKQTSYPYSATVHGLVLTHIITAIQIFNINNLDQTIKIQ